MILLICGIKKMTEMNLFTKWKQTHRHKKTNLGLPKRKEWQRNKLGVWN